MSGRPPLLLDLFCSAGGTSMGYHRAGFEVVGVDLEPQPNYPFRFMQMDALALDPERIVGLGFKGVAASPPCQAYSKLGALQGGKEYPDLVGPTRALLEQTGLPYVIENVVGAPLIRPVQLCGSSFGLPLQRHRLFEANWQLVGAPCDHDWQDRYQPYRADAARRDRTGGTGIVTMYGSTNYAGEGRLREIAIGIDWMTQPEMAQAIPPAYTMFIGRQLRRHLAT